MSVWGWCQKITGASAPAHIVRTHHSMVTASRLYAQSVSWIQFSIFLFVFWPGQLKVKRIRKKELNDLARTKKKEKENWHGQLSFHFIFFGNRLAWRVSAGFPRKWKRNDVLSVSWSHRHKTMNEPPNKNEGKRMNRWAAVTVWPVYDCALARMPLTVQGTCISFSLRDCPGARRINARCHGHFAWPDNISYKRKRNVGT